MNLSIRLALLILVCGLTGRVRAGDWPQFRHDIGRTAASPHGLPDNLKLRWTRKLPAPRPAFPFEHRLAYDASYEPVVLGGTMFVPSMVTDSVMALDVESGKDRWIFFAEGPVRFAPVAWKDRVYFVSDDGHLYCLNAGDGTLRWKFRGLPKGRQDRKVIGHGRLISLFPARGGPVLADGVVYFAAGLWPTEGVFVHAVDAETGGAVWSNTECHNIPRSNWDHGIGQRAGLTPQGYLAIVGDRLVVPCGAQLPGFLDLKTGKLQTYTMGWGGRNGLPKGCWFVAGAGKFLSHGGDLFDITRRSTEQLKDLKPGQFNFMPLMYPGGWTRLDIEAANQRELDSFRMPVLTPDVIYDSQGGIMARDLTTVKLKKLSPEALPAHRKEDPYPDLMAGAFQQLWKLPSKLDLHIKAGDRLYAGGKGAIEAIGMDGENPKVLWRSAIKGTPQRMLAAGGKLFVVTVEGEILCFGEAHADGVKVFAGAGMSLPTAGSSGGQAGRILQATGVRDGYALCLGIDDGRLVEELIRQSDVHVIAVEDDPDKAAALQHRLFRMGVYGTRASVHVGDPVSFPFSPYMASLVVTETPDRLAATKGRTLARSVFHVLQPYGGVAVAWGALADQDRIAKLAGKSGLHGVEVLEKDGFVLMKRAGGLPGAADWSHAQANAAGTGASEDAVVRSPMGILWFDAAQRWHKYPGQDLVRVAGGRQVLFEEGVMRASDVYTGRKLWEVAVPFGKKPLADASDRDAVRYARHRQWGPKASFASITQLVAMPDGIYLSAGAYCLVFDPATGRQTGRIDLPEDLQSPWVNLRVSGDYLVGTSGAHVVCMHRLTGRLVWRVKAGRAALSLAAGGGRVFCAEVPNPRRGENETKHGRIFALDLATGKQVWEKAGGARLRYSPSLDIVVTPARLYAGRNGAILPRKPGAPSQRLVIQGNGLPKEGVPGYIAGNRLLTGNEDNLFVHKLPSCTPMGKPLKWVRRGCTATRASTHLLTTRYRSNSAWIDLDSRKITPLIGIRPGCSVNNNLYPANGVMNIPNLTAGCVCNFAPVSMACVPVAALE